MKPRRVQCELAQRVFQLVPAPAHVAFASDDLQDVGVPDPVPGLSGAPPVDAHLAGHDGPLGAAPALAQATLHQCLVQTRHHGLWERKSRSKSPCHCFVTARRGLHQEPEMHPVPR